MWDWGQSSQSPFLRGIYLSASEFVDGDAAQEFGIKIGGFLRHDAAGEGDAGHVFDWGGFQKERDLGAMSDFGGGGVDAAHVLDEFLIAHGFLGDAEQAAENVLVQNRDVEAILFAGALHQADFAVGDDADLHVFRIAVGHAAA